MLNKIRVIRKYSLAMMMTALLIVGIGYSGVVVAQQANASDRLDLFAELVPEVVETSVLPVLIPTEIPARTDETLYPEIIDSTAQSYEFAYGKVLDCSNAGFCREGWFQGYQVGAPGYKNESISELIAERAEHLEKATRTSDDPIEAVTLVDGTAAIVLPWIGYVHPGGTEVIFDKGGYRYVIAVLMAENDYVISLANSAVMRPQQPE